MIPLDSHEICGSERGCINTIYKQFLRSLMTLMHEKEEAFTVYTTLRIFGTCIGGFWTCNRRSRPETLATRVLGMWPFRVEVPRSPRKMR